MFLDHSPGALRQQMSFWHHTSLRTQVILSVAALLVVATLFASIVAIWNGRKAVMRETQASIAFAERYIVTFLNRLETEGRLGDLKRQLPQEIATLRHVDIYLRSKDGQTKLVRPLDSVETDALLHNGENVPSWFTQALSPQSSSVPDRLVFNHQLPDVILISGRASDEIEEKWEELADLAMIWFATLMLLIAGLYAVLGWILTPLSALSGGLGALEVGERKRRVDIPRVRELADICHSFNALAESLDRTRQENGDLYRQVVSVQEEERRLLASELHDEAGPCLFGITANTESVQRIAEQLDDDAQAKLLARADVILRIVERLKSMNRALLRRLRPVAIGKISLTELIGELVDEYAKNHSDTEFNCQVELDRSSYGDALDLTIYRSVQEALTNSVRHGQPTICNVHIGIDSDDRSADNSQVDDSRQQIVLYMRDNGSGFDQSNVLGFGLASMRERILMHGGTFTIGPNWPSGVLIVISIPIPAAASESAASAKGAQAQTNLLEQSP